MKAAACLLAACLLAAPAAGCRPRLSEPGESLWTGPRALRRVLLPDLTGMTPAVQAAIRRAHAAIESAAAPGSPGARAAAYGELGNLFLSIGYFGSAEVCYDNARTLAPLESRWSYYLGHAYRHLGDLDRSAGAFNRALQMDPDYLPARIWLGEVVLLAGRTEFARLAFTAALSWEPRLQAALFGLGRAALEEHDYGAAADYLRQALAVDPGVSAIHYPLALAYRGLGNTEQAEAHLRQRGPVQPALTDAWMQEIERR